MFLISNAKKDPGLAVTDQLLKRVSDKVKHEYFDHVDLDIDGLKSSSGHAYRKMLRYKDLRDLLLRMKNNERLTDFERQELRSSLSDFRKYLGRKSKKK